MGHPALRAVRTDSDDPGVAGSIMTVMTEQRIRRRLVVRGRVQGVFFRDATQERARAAGVGGWVRNRDDRSVEVVLEGPAEAVERVARFCESGPSRAGVEDVESRQESPEGLDGFEVR
jgi:acylphosphatase